MDLHLTNKVFIVTGGARGIGASISQSIAAEGGIVVIAGRDKNDNHQIVDDIVKKRGRGASHTVELAEPGACKEVIEFAIEKYSRIDGIVNNAGVNDGVGLANGSPEKFMGSLQKNLSHYYNLVHYGLPHLKNTKGSIVNIGSRFQ